jgi:hypothetical protein
MRNGRMHLSERVRCQEAFRGIYFTFTSLSIVHGDDWRRIQQASSGRNTNVNDGALKYGE